jgi:alanine racemase
VHIDYEEPWNLLHVDLSAIQTNYQYLRNKVPSRAVLYAVLKSNAYGHGIVEVGKALEQAGARHFAVESPQEGIQLRQIGFDGEILLMNPIPEWMVEMSVYHDFSVSVIHESILDPLENACCQMKKTCKLHLNANVGLHRMGIPPSRLLKVATSVATHPHLVFEGLFAQPRDDKDAPGGYRKLMQMYSGLRDENLAPNSVHYANSTTFLSHPDTTRDGVRLGIILYGVMPPEQHNMHKTLSELKPAMSLTSSVVQTRNLEKGSLIGYRAKQRTTRDSVIGTIPIGYSHGLDRSLSNGGYVLVRGGRAPFIGAISMNSSTIDLTDLGHARRGETVTLIGRQGNESIVVNDLASRSKTISAEVMVRVGGGIARRYIMGKSISRQKTFTFEGGHVRYTVRTIRTEKDLPSWLNAHKLVAFISENSVPYQDARERIRKALDFALSSYKHGEGFVVLATRNRRTVGVAVCVETGTSGFIPENTLVYVCVHRDHRKRGIGRRVLTEAMSNAEGSFKLHVKRGNPARKFCKKMGFSDNHVEMRYETGAIDE